MSETVLRVKNLETFYGPVMAIRGVTLEVGKGQIVTILGSNGAGKTTTFNMVAGALEPSAGRHSPCAGGEGGFPLSDRAGKP